jgi:predicted RNase H-like HicB family nuclease
MENVLIFTGVILKEKNGYSALCIDTDVASDGSTAEEAKSSLIEAVNLYIESALESNLPIVRPIPAADNPVLSNDPRIASTFKIHVDLQVHTYA